MIATTFFTFNDTPNPEACELHPLKNTQLAGIPKVVSSMELVFSVLTTCFQEQRPKHSPNVNNQNTVQVCILTSLLSILGRLGKQGGNPAKAETPLASYLFKCPI